MSANQGSVDVVIFAGGVGRRMTGSSRPKQFLELSGRPIIDYTIARFANHPEIDHIVVACLGDWIPFLNEWLSRCNYETPITVIPGGSTGQESIFRGVKKARDLHPNDDDAVVLIHDGVRPLIDAETISACIDSVKTRGSTVTIAPSTETIILSNESGSVDKVLPRSLCGLGRAPQGFMLKELFSAHLRAVEEGLTDFIDSISLMDHYGYPVFSVVGPAENIKVTTPVDYYAFKGYMEAMDQKTLWEES